MGQLGVALGGLAALLVASRLLASVIFALVLGPETLLFVVASCVWLAYLFLWRGHASTLRTLFSSTPRVSASAIFLGKAKDSTADDSVRSLHALSSLILSLVAPVLDARLTFWLCELLRRRNPFPVLSHPVASVTVGSVAPAFMHLRRVVLEENAVENSHTYSLDFVLADSDAKVTIAALNSSITITGKQINMAGCLFVRVDPVTGEVAVCLRDEPMFKIQIELSDGPDFLRSVCANYLEGLIVERVYPNWTSLGLLSWMFGMSIQQELNAYRNSMHLSRASSLALDAGVARLVSRQHETAVEAASFALNVAAAPAAPEVPEQGRVTAPSTPRMETAAVLQGAPCVISGGVVAVSSSGDLFFVAGSASPVEMVAGCHIDAKRGICGVGDKEGGGSVVAGVSQEKKLVVVWQKNGHPWQWRLMSEGGDLRRLVGIIVSEHNWHFVVQDSFVVLCMTVPKFNSQSSPKIASLGSASCCEVFSPKKGGNGLVAMISKGELVLLALSAKEDLTFFARKPLHVSVTSELRFSCFSLKKKVMLESVMIAYVKSGHILVDNCDVTDSLRKQSVAVNDAVGHLSVVVVSGDIWITFRDLMGSVNVLRGPAPEKLKLIPDVGRDAAGDPVIFPATAFGLEVAWCGTDGAVHRASL